MIAESPIIAFASSCCIWDLIWNTQFAGPLKFWFELNRLKNDEWFSLTDEIIDLIGYKSSASNVSNNRKKLRFIRKHYIEETYFLMD